MRELVLWVTGRDHLAPPEHNFHFLKPDEPRWEMTFAPNTNIRFNMNRGPNFVHRFLQRWLLGICWTRGEYK